MKHEVINTTSTENVLRMMFECKTFDVENKEKNVRRFETKIQLKVSEHKTKNLEFETVRALSI